MTPICLSTAPCSSCSTSAGGYAAPLKAPSLIFISVSSVRWAASRARNDMTISDLPAVNALLNSLSTIFLINGYLLIKRGRQAAHRNCMIGALVTSTLFLTSYVYYHYNAGRTDFINPEWFRPIYLVILVTHIILAVVIVPLALMTVILAVRRRYELHKRISRWTWPLWMYVSVTGVLIYFLLYQIFPQTKP